MSFVTLDFETYYDKDYSLSKMTTEEYIRDPRFEVIGVGVKVDDNPPEWFSGTHKETKAFLDKIDWTNSAVLCHNTLFDGGILSFAFDIIPAYYFDTLSMARALHGTEVSGSLKAMAQYYEIGEKGTEVINALGKRRADFAPHELAAYASYCLNDVELTYKLLHAMGAFPSKEYDLIDMTLRMYTQPVFHINDALLVDRLEEIKREKSELLRGLMGVLEVGTEEEVRKKLASNPQFAALLMDMGITPPTKISPTTNKETFAFAKTDEGFIELTEHENPIVQQLCAVRLGTKSTIEESRVERFIGIGARNKGLLPIPLKYYGAHTGRWSGSDSVNLQNLPSRDKRKKAIKNSIMAPPGHVVINSDSSQIEARVLAWLSGQNDLVNEFAKGRDVYCTFATKIYRRPITKEDVVERFVGKTCIAEGTPVLCRQGWKPIETVTTDDQLWDGEKWVCHDGVVSNGIKPTLNLCGLWLTPDHLVWSGTWHRADFLQQDADTLSQALDIAAVNLPSQGSWSAPVVSEGYSYAATALQRLNTQSTTTTSKTSSLLDAIYARSTRLIGSVIGGMQSRFQMMPIVQDSSTGSPLRSPAAIYLQTLRTHTMDSAASKSLKSGGMIGPSFFGMFRRLKGGMTRSYRWTGSTSTGTTNRTTYDSCQQVKTWRTRDESQILKPVYDILNSGSKNRFTVLTDKGPLIVHNCILGLGYGTGAKKLQHTLKTQPPGAVLPEEECKAIVDLYRAANYRIPQFWAECDAVLSSIMGGRRAGHFGIGNVVLADTDSILLPNGMRIRYPNLRRSEGKFIYDSRHGVRSIWGGAVTENVVQALARIIVGEQMLAVSQRYRPALTVHDALTIVVPEEEAEQAMEFVGGIMKTPPEWAPGLPVACTVTVGETYGDC